MSELQQEQDSKLRRLLMTCDPNKLDKRSLQSTGYQTEQSIKKATRGPRAYSHTCAGSVLVVCKISCGHIPTNGTKRTVVWVRSWCARVLWWGGSGTAWAGQLLIEHFIIVHLYTFIVPALIVGSNWIVIQSCSFDEWKQNLDYFLKQYTDTCSPPVGDMKSRLCSSWRFDHSPQRVFHVTATRAIL